ncbi:PepSY domain-containing protein [Bacillus sp. FJAT-49732]|uniref:PepSY domain-containing protein n=1 Tax=Lederbergia citrisecunda TaxID=2833583 RepID=A0A942TQ73_9BACI|nr:PepSY domain-containing protein [Lederbergia citrisecunda]MBS4200047.1 PepSY domain-containing protein [Lederbergia citrisecunda]
MNWKSFIAGAVAGIVGGYCLSKKIRETMPLSGEEVLADVKHAFKKEGKIDGSWMQMKPEDYKKYAIQTKVYRGGITTRQNGERQQYEFIADAYTGSVIDIYPL